MIYPEKNEIDFINKIIKSSPRENIKRINKMDYLVEDADDGGMKGLKFLTKKEKRKLGEDIAQLQFTDEDNIPVIVTLSLDNYGELFELDIWKVDFSPLKIVLSGDIPLLPLTP